MEKAVWWLRTSQSCCLLLTKTKAAIPFSLLLSSYSVSLCLTWSELIGWTVSGPILFRRQLVPKSRSTLARSHEVSQSVAAKISPLTRTACMLLALLITASCIAIVLLCTADYSALYSTVVYCRLFLLCTAIMIFWSLSLHPQLSACTCSAVTAVDIMTTTLCTTCTM